MTYLFCRSQTGIHPSHPPNVERETTEDLRHDLIPRQQQDSSRSCRDVYDEFLTELQPEQANLLPNYQAVRNTLNRTRRRHAPPLPATANDVRIRGTWALTLRTRRRFMLKLDAERGICVFATSRDIEYLADCKLWYLGATFKSVSRPYKQLLVIHGELLAGIE